MPSVFPSCTRQNRRHRAFPSIFFCREFIFVECLLTLGKPFAECAIKNTGKIAVCRHYRCRVLFAECFLAARSLFPVVRRPPTVEHGRFFVQRCSRERRHHRFLRDECAGGGGRGCGGRRAAGEGEERWSAGLSSRRAAQPTQGRQPQGHYVESVATWSASGRLRRQWWGPPLNYN